jgi:hypothetical protein
VSEDVSSNSSIGVCFLDDKVGLTQRQREIIGLTVREKDTGSLRIPGYDCLNDFMNLLNPQDLAKVLTSWLQVNQGRLPASLALDGKSIGDGKIKQRHYSVAGIRPRNGRTTSCSKR